MAGSAGRVIKRAHEPGFAAQQLKHVLLVPEVVAARDRVNAGRKNFLSRSRRNARTTRGIFAICHYKIHRMSMAQSRKQFPDGAAAGLTDDVTNEEQFHRP